MYRKALLHLRQQFRRSAIMYGMAHFRDRVRTNPSNKFVVYGMRTGSSFLFRNELCPYPTEFTNRIDDFGNF